jgi:hypothetical protein
MRSSSRGCWPAFLGRLRAQTEMTGIPEQGYWLRPLDKAQPGPTHRLGGKTRIPGAQCPNCRKPLLTLWELDARDPLLGFQAAGLARLSVLFCWTCPVAQSVLMYQLPSAATSFRLLDVASGKPTPDFPYEGYPIAFASQELTLVALTLEEQDILRRLNVGGDVDWSDRRYQQLSRPRHQIGGEPYLVQPLEEVHCSGCGAAMPLFGTVGNDTFGPEKFTDNDYVQTLVHLCRHCWIVAVYQRCD